MAAASVLGIGEQAAPALPSENVNLIKVFSATKARDRERLGERATVWLQAHPAIRVLRAVVTLTSDSEFHCLSIVIIAYRPSTDDVSK